MQRRVVCFIVCPIIVLLVLTLLISLRYQNIFPHDFDSSAWLEFSEHVSASLHADTTAVRVCLLLLVHMLHMYLCLPMLHLTKIMYGYWLGIVRGSVLCCLWELLLMWVYVAAVRREPQKELCSYTQKAREEGSLTRDLLLVSLSSFPLQVTASLVQFGDASTREFMLASLVVTTVTSIKNVLCGAVLAQAPSTRNMLAVSAVVAFSSVMPTLCTLYVSSKTLYLVLRQVPPEHTTAEVQALSADVEEVDPAPSAPELDADETQKLYPV